ncbi:MAG: hypothetical protein ABIG39_05640 [Candidatus Micrarchaeota archaeon]
MAESPQSLFGRVHCTTLLEFSDMEEIELLREYDRTSSVGKANQQPSGGRLFGL